ncbi:MAG TPA: cupin domain-containing protein, partial [Frankiaceae bacterium]|nr:cupin domain-containing protein [Frankiaceae bacterium]
ELWRTPAGSCATLLVGSDPPNPLELWDWRVAPGEAHDSEGHQAGTRELLTVVDGVLTLTVGGERHRVEVGDGVLFDGGRPHRYANDGPAPLRFTLAVHAPVPSPGTP